jgi:amphiphysin
MVIVSAMTAAQSRLAETLDTFYSASDRTSDGAMAAHAYKQSVDDLDQGVGRELVRLYQSLSVRPP